MHDNVMVSQYLVVMRAANKTPPQPPEPNAMYDLAHDSPDYDLLAELAAEAAYDAWIDTLAATAAALEAGEDEGEDDVWALAA